MSSSTAPVGVALAVLAAVSGAVLVTAAVSSAAKRTALGGVAGAGTAVDCEDRVFPYVQSDCRSTEPAADTRIAGAQTAPAASAVAPGANLPERAAVVAIDALRPPTDAREPSVPGAQAVTAEVPRPALAVARAPSSPEAPAAGEASPPTSVPPAREAAPPKAPDLLADIQQPPLAEPKAEQARAVDLGQPKIFAGAAEPHIASVGAATLPPAPAAEPVRAPERSPLAPVATAAPEPATFDRTVPAEPKRARTIEPKPARAGKVFAPIVTSRAAEAPPPALERPEVAGRRVRVIQIDRAQASPETPSGTAEAAAAAALAAARPSEEERSPLSRLATVVSARVAAGPSASSRPGPPGSTPSGEPTFLAAASPASATRPVAVSPVQATTAEISSTEIGPLAGEPTEKADRAVLAAPPAVAPTRLREEFVASPRDPVAVASIPAASPAARPLILTVPTETTRPDGTLSAAARTATVLPPSEPAPQQPRDAGPLLLTVPETPAHGVAAPGAAPAADGAAGAARLVTAPMPPVRAQTPGPDVSAPAGPVQGLRVLSRDEKRAVEQARRRAEQDEKLQRLRDRQALRTAERVREAEEFRRFRAEREARWTERRFERRRYGESAGREAWTQRNWNDRRPDAVSDDPPPGRTFYVRRAPEGRRPGGGILGWLGGSND